MRKSLYYRIINYTRISTSKAEKRKKMKFGRDKDKLYKQWVKHSDLPSEAIPQKESSEDVPVDRGRNKQGPHLLYILLGVGILILCVGLVLLLVQSC